MNDEGDDDANCTPFGQDKIDMTFKGVISNDSVGTCHATRVLPSVDIEDYMSIFVCESLVLSLCLEGF